MVRPTDSKASQARLWSSGRRLAAGQPFGCHVCVRCGRREVARVKGCGLMM
jgi:hypothetical protein